MKLHRAFFSLTISAALAFVPRPSWAIDLPLLRDATVSISFPTTTYGGAETIQVKSAYSYPGYATVLAFNKNTLPPNTTGAQVSQALLKLFVNTHTSDGAINIYRITANWAEATATYNSLQANRVLYQTALPVSVPASKNYLVLDVTALVKDWLNGTANFDHGIWLDYSGMYINMTFDSKESLTTSQPATLEVQVIKRIPAQGDLTMGQFNSGTPPP